MRGAIGVRIFYLDALFTIFNVNDEIFYGAMLGFVVNPIIFYFCGGLRYDHKTAYVGLALGIRI